MANQYHLTLLRHSAEQWDAWREHHPTALPDLSKAERRREQCIYWS